MSFSRFAIGIGLLLCSLLLPCGSSTAETLFRLNPTPPKDLLEKVYNNALVGNDRLSDIESYMSPTLKSDYKKAIKATKKGINCEIPRIIVNGIFSGKLKGFKVTSSEEKDGATEIKVTLDIDANDQTASDQLSQFDPKIYEVVNFTLVRKFINWKIENIRTLEPDLDHLKTSISYKPLDLKEVLKQCYLKIK